MDKRRDDENAQGEHTLHPSEVKNEAIFREIELYSRNRDSLEKMLLVLSSTPLIAIFAMLVTDSSDISNASLLVSTMYMAAFVLYLFILYNLVKYMTKMVRLNSYLGYLDEIITSTYGMRDILLWHREINIEEKYSFTGSLFQAPFHLAAFFMLGSVYLQAHSRVYSDSRGTAVASDVMVLLLGVCILFMLFAAITAHWDTKGSINKDRIRNRLVPMPPYYADFWSYLPIYSLERPLERFVVPAAKQYWRNSYVTVADDFPCVKDLAIEPDRCNTDAFSYLATKIKICIKSIDVTEIQACINVEPISKKSVYVPVSFRNKSVLMAFWKECQTDQSPTYLIGCMSLMAPAAVGDHVLIWNRDSVLPSRRREEPRVVALGTVIGIEESF